MVRVPHGFFQGLVASNVFSIKKLGRCLRAGPGRAPVRGRAGGGAGGKNPNGGTAGTNGTGGGGGASGNDSQPSGKGGDGLVIVRYTKAQVD